MKRTITDEELERMLGEALKDYSTYGSSRDVALRDQAIGMLAIAYNKVVSRMDIMEKQRRVAHQL